MSLHDHYARLTPFEVAFPDRAVVDRLLGAVAAETEERGLDDSEPEAFVTTLAVAELVRALRSPEAAPESTYPFGMLVFHCVHFARAGCPLYLLETAAARRLVSVAPASAGAVPLPPSTAGYLQFPQHLIWTEGEAAGVPESLDGVFWTLAASRTLHVLPISGLRPERPGFGALALPGAPWADAGSWLGAHARESGQDFSSTLPGGALDALYSVQTAGEVLKLLARFFVRAATVSAGFQSPQALGTGDAPGAPAEGPRPSALPYTRVTLGSG